MSTSLSGCALQRLLLSLEESNQVLVESEKEFFKNKKSRGDVFDPFTEILYEIQRDLTEIRKKKKIFYESNETEFVEFT